MTYAFVFPGQGSQSVGMLAELAAAFPSVRQTFEQASDALSYDLWKQVQEGPEETLNRTETTQPAMLTAGIAVSRVWLEQGGGTATLCAGHSLGEYTALVYANALAFGDAVKLTAARGRFMQEAAPPGSGAMAAILGLDDAKIAEICTAAAQGETVSPANYNSPGQTVIAGHRGAVERAMQAAKAAKAKRAVLLPVSAPSHCTLMRPAVQPLVQALARIEIKAPEIPVLHNIDAASHSDITALRQALEEQLCQPVRWVQTMEKIAAEGIITVIECGPGRVLTGLNKRIAKQLNCLCVHDPKSLDEALQAVENNG